MLLELRDALRRPAALWARREQALMAELHDCRARLSCKLSWPNCTTVARVCRPA
jgi:hypothetical protein